MAIIKKVVTFAMTLFFRIVAPCIPVKKNMAIFISFHGRGFSDNPKAIYMEMQKDARFQTFQCIWAVRKNVNVNIPGAKVVRYFRPAYFYYLARSEYWISNCKLPIYVKKKTEQIYLQTWHGTPLKRLAHDIIVPEGTTFYRSNMSADAMRKTYDDDVKRYTCMISPNAFCTKIFQSAFQIDRERLIETGYPRNDELSHITLEMKQELMQKYHIPPHKKVILYAPTWRDNQFNTAGYTFFLEVDFHMWKKVLGDNYIVLFKPHYLITNSYQHDTELQDFVYDIDAKDDIVDLYKISDVLITDYSSVFFDYAILKRPIYFYMYDMLAYAKELRGFYLDIHKDLPGEIYEQEEAMLYDIRNAVFNDAKLQKFNDRFNHMEDGASAKRVLDVLYQEAQ